MPRFSLRDDDGVGEASSRYIPSDFCLEMEHCGLGGSTQVQVRPCVFIVRVEGGVGVSLRSLSECLGLSGFGLRSGRRIMPRVFLIAVLALLLSATVAQAAPMSVVLWGQADPQWSSIPLGQGGYTLGQAGCAVTAVSMVANYYGSAKNPGEICTWLNNNGGFKPGTGYVYWGSIPAAAGGTIQYAGNIDYPGIPADMNKINSELDAGYPVVAGVNGYTHYIVITGHDGGTYYINDPGGPTIPYGRQGTFNQWYGSPVANYIDGIFMYHGTHTSPPPPASLTASAAKPAFNTGEHVVVNWTAYPGATKYGLTVWKAPYTGDANIVWDNYVTGTSMDIGTLPLNSYRIHMAAYVGTTLVKLSNYCDFSVVNPPDITAPQTTSNRVTYYASSATIHLTATDNAGGSGVAHTYYRLNGAAQVEGTTITKSTAGSYSLVYWSVDAAGNIEAAHTVTFTIIAKPSSGGTPSTPASIATLKHGKSFTVYGYIIRHASGTSPVTLQFYRYQSGHWVLKKSTTAKASNMLTFSKYSDSTSVPYSGKWRVRARHKVGSKYLYSGYRNFSAS